MNFFTVGSASDYVNLKKLEFKWTERKNNPFLPKGKNEDSFTARFSRQTEEGLKSNNISLLRGKMQTGAPLSPDEMEYLKENSPELYETAKKIENERNEYKKALKNCRSREDVEKLKLGSLSRLAAEAKAISTSSGISTERKKELLEQAGMRVMAITYEHNRFIATSAYRALPERSDDSRAKRGGISTGLQCVQTPGRAVKSDKFSFSRNIVCGAGSKPGAHRSD